MGILSWGESMTDGEIRDIFGDTEDLVVRDLNCGGFLLHAYAIDGMVSGSEMSEYILKPVSEHLCGNTMEELYHAALSGAVYNSVANACDSVQAIAAKLVNGFCVVLFPESGAIAFEIKSGARRMPGSPEVENTVKGPKDAFVETVRINTSLIRCHLRTPELRFTGLTVGKRSMTHVSVAWVRGITNPELVTRMEQRVKSIEVDGLLSPSAVEEYITGSRATAFPLMQYTERADKFSQGLLDGRVGLLVDGLPLGYLAPADLGFLMESPEDRSRDYVSASCVRLLRYCALILSLLLPGLYIALAVFHQEMIPLPLLRSIIDSKENVPFSTTLEVLGLLTAFELLQESGIHLPQAIGQSVSTIGGIVVGTAAVEAGLVSPAALIVVSIAGVCGFVLPNRDLAEAVRVWRFGIAALGAAAGLFGVTMGFLILLIHLSGLTCLDVPYLAPFSEGKDLGVLRWRLKFKKFRNEKLHPVDKRNQK